MGLARRLLQVNLVAFENGIVMICGKRVYDLCSSTRSRFKLSCLTEHHQERELWRFRTQSSSFPAYTLDFMLKEREIVNVFDFWLWTNLFGANRPNGTPNLTAVKDLQQGVRTKIT